MKANTRIFGAVATLAITVPLFPLSSAYAAPGCEGTLEGKGIASGELPQVTLANRDLILSNDAECSPMTSDKPFKTLPDGSQAFQNLNEGDLIHLTFADSSEADVEIQGVGPVLTYPTPTVTPANQTAENGSVAFDLPALGDLPASSRIYNPQITIKVGSEVTTWDFNDFPTSHQVVGANEVLPVSMRIHDDNGYSETYDLGKVRFISSYVSWTDDLDSYNQAGGYAGRVLAAADSSTDLQSVRVQLLSSTGTVISDETFNPTTNSLWVNMPKPPADYSGDFKVVVTASTTAGAVSHTVLSNVDRTGPSVDAITLTPDGSSFVIGGTTYYRPDSQYVFEVSDVSGVASAYLVKAATAAEALTAPAVKDNVPTESTNYFVVAVDNFGNKTARNLGAHRALGNTAGVSSLTPATTWVPSSTVFKLVLDNDPVVPITVTAQTLGIDLEVTNTGARTYDIKYPSDFGQPATPLTPITIQISDVIGNVKTSSYRLRIDDWEPEYQGLSLSGGSVNALGDYVSTDSISLHGTFNDLQSGLTKVEVLNDGVVVDTITPAPDTPYEISYEIKATGTYTVRLTDLAGHSTTLSVSDFNPEVTSERIVIDNTTPKIASPSSLDGLAEYKGISWVLTDPTDLSFTIDDNFALYRKGTTATLDGNPVQVDFVSPSKGTIVVSKDDLVVGQTHVLVITATDLIGNKTTFERTLRYSPAIPKVGGTITGDAPINATPFGTYSQSAQTVSLKFLDELIEIDTPSPATFSVTTGTPSFKVTDPFGRTSTHDLKGLFGYPTARFIVDSTVPTFENIDLNGKWVGSVGAMPQKVKVTDNEALKSVSLSINGSETFSTTFGELSKTFDIPVDYSKVSRKADGSFEVSYTAVDQAGNSSSGSYTVYLDDVAPSVVTFEVVDPTYAPGKKIGGSDSVYGFFLQNAPKVRIFVNDPAPSSGIKDVTVTLRTSSGSETVSTIKAQAGVAEVSLPANFKGFISAKVTDNVEHSSPVARPDGVVSEMGNLRITATDLGIELPSAPSTDYDGNPLYRDRLQFNLTAKASQSGIRTISYGVGTETLFTSQEVSGSSRFSKITRDRNLVTNVTIPVALSGDYRGQPVWLKVTDNAGVTAETRRVFSVDATVPTLDLTFSATNANNFYNSNRSATITVKDANFDPTRGVTLTGKYGSLSGWSRNGDTWTATLSFTDNTDYAFSLSVADKVGHTSQTITPTPFTVDKVLPVASLTFSDNNVANGKYYKTDRKATITVVDEHFDTSSANLTGNGKLSGWSQSGNTHTAVVTWGAEGPRTLGFSAKDKATNSTNVLTTPEFIVDTKPPVYAISGVSDKTVYHQTPILGISFTDTYPDKGTVVATLKGRKGTTHKIPFSWDGNTAKVSYKDFPDNLDGDDLYSLVFAGSDLAGNKVSKSLSFTVNRHGSVFQISADNSFNGEYLTVARDVVLSETTVEELDLSKTKIRVTLNGAVYPVDPSMVKIERTGGDKGSFNYTYTINKDAFADEGVYLVEITSTTKSGTENASKLSYSFAIDRTAPTVVVTGVEDGVTYKEQEVLVTLAPRDASPVEVTATLNGESVELTPVEGGTYSLTIPESSSVQNLVVKAVDKAGNTGSVEVKDFYINSSGFQTFVHDYGKYWPAPVSALLLGAAGVFLAMKRRSRNDEQVGMDDIL